MSFYKEKRKLALWIDERMKGVLNGDELNVAKTVITATGLFEVGEKAVLTRLGYWKNAFDVLVEEEGVIRFEPESA